MDWGLLISLGSLIVAGTLALLRYWEYRRDAKRAYEAGMVETFKAPAERDSIIIGGAQQAVQLLRDALSDAQSRIAYLEKEVARLRNDCNGGTT